MQQVCAWLASQGHDLAQAYGDAFRSQEINGVALLALTEQDLRDELGVSVLGHRKRIVKGIEALKGPPPPQPVYAQPQYQFPAAMYHQPPPPPAAAQQQYPGAAYRQNQPVHPVVVRHSGTHMVVSQHQITPVPPMAAQFAEPQKQKDPALKRDNAYFLRDKLEVDSKGLWTQIPWSVTPRHNEQLTPIQEARKPRTERSHGRQERQAALDLFVCRSIRRTQCAGVTRSSARQRHRVL